LTKDIDKILEHLNEEINNMESELDDVLLKAEKGIKITKKILLRLRNQILKTGFSNTKEEINFFKNIKPKIYSILIYHVKLFNIESKRPRGISKSQKKYLDREIKKLQIYFNDNLEFYQYYRRGGISLDNHYFVRGKEDIRLRLDNFHFFTDENFSTSHDSTVATIMAYDMLIVYLQQEIEKIENRNGMETTIKANQLNTKLFWTGNKVDLVELIYALHASGDINKGTADIKEMASAFEHIFNVELGDFYRTFLEIRSRKINNTKFIDLLKESLTKRMDESDE